MKPTAIPTVAKPLLAALALALAFATTACQREQAPVDAAIDESAETETTPIDTMPAPLPPLQESNPCANLIGAELDECLRRQSLQPVTPPPSEQLEPLPPPAEDPPVEPEETPTAPPPG